MGTRPRGTALQGPSERYLAALLQGDAVTADVELGALVRAGTPKAVAFDGVVAPALHRVGELWARAELTIADEHMASAVARQSCERLAEPPRPPAPGAPIAVVACASDERHELGARMVADCLVEAGWRVSFLGAAVPAAETAAFAARRRADLVALSLSLPEQLEGVLEVSRLLDGPGRPRVVVGGAAVRALRDPRVLGAAEACDDLAAFSREAAEVARSAGACRPSRD